MGSSGVARVMMGEGGGIEAREGLLGAGCAASRAFIEGMLWKDWGATGGAQQRGTFYLCAED